MAPKKASRGKKGGRRGGCGATMYGGNVSLDGVSGMQARSTWAGSSLQGGAIPLSPLELESDKQVPVPVKMGGRSRRFLKGMPRKSRRSRKSMKVFPNNIFRNMF